MRKRSVVVFLFSSVFVLATFSQDLKPVRIELNLLQTALTAEYAMPIGQMAIGIGGGIGLLKGDEISALLIATLYPFSSFANGLLVSGGYIYSHFLPDRDRIYIYSHDLNINLGYRVFWGELFTGTVQIGYNHRLYGFPLEPIEHLWLGLTIGVAL